MVSPASPTPGKPHAVAEPLRTHLNQTHDWLLRIHKALLDHEKIRYEKSHGPIKDAGAFLNLLLSDGFFGWLRAVSGLIVQIDEYLESKKPLPGSDGQALLSQARSLLIPAEHGGAFQKEYFRAIQESPDIARLHTAWKTAVPAVAPQA